MTLSRELRDHGTVNFGWAPKGLSNFMDSLVSSFEKWGTHCKMKYLESYNILRLFNNYMQPARGMSAPAGEPVVHIVLQTWQNIPHASSDEGK